MELNLDSLWLGSSLAIYGRQLRARKFTRNTFWAAIVLIASKHQEFWAVVTFQLFSRAPRWWRFACVSVLAPFSSLKFGHRVFTISDGSSQLFNCCRLTSLRNFHNAAVNREIVILASESDRYDGRDHYKIFIFLDLFNFLFIILLKVSKWEKYPRLNWKLLNRQKSLIFYWSSI